MSEQKNPCAAFSYKSHAGLFEFHSDNKKIFYHFSFFCGSENWGENIEQI